MKLKALTKFEKFTTWQDWLMWAILCFVVVSSPFVVVYVLFGWFNEALFWMSIIFTVIVRLIVQAMLVHSDNRKAQP